MPVIQAFSYSFTREASTRSPSPLQQSAEADMIASLPSTPPAAAVTMAVLACLTPSPRALAGAGTEARVSPCSSPRPSPPVSPVMGPCLPFSAISTVSSTTTPSLSPSKPIPISPSGSLPANHTAHPDTCTPSTATRSKPTRGPFCEAAPILSSPESADPLRYCMLLEDRQRHHRSVPSPSAPVIPKPSTIQVPSPVSIPGISSLLSSPEAAGPVLPAAQYHVPEQHSSSPSPPRSSSTSPNRILSPLPRLDIARSAIREKETPILPSPILPFSSRNTDSPRRRSSLLRIAHVVRSESCSPTLSPSTSETDMSRPESPTSTTVSAISETVSATRIAADAVRNRFPVMTTSSPSKFVGSYEESLLSRRLSARRSKPIVFNATIGVIGHGKCKPALRCPPHMMVAFSAHYYNFEDDDLLGGGSPVPTSSFGPSPPSPTHVVHPATPSGLRPALGWFAAPGTGSTTAPSHSPTRPASAPTWTPYVGVVDLSLLKASPSTDSLATAADEQCTGPPKPNKEGVVGGYRIPPRGQLQIVIKNPHQSALKVFLVPYDLSKMPKGTKTAMRHKQYARPVDEQPQQPHTDAACASAPSTRRKRSLSHRSLRYALHIPIVCTPRGRHYLAGSGGLRVVFSGKSPESHERLDAVTELAGGFTPWVPTGSSTCMSRANSKPLVSPLKHSEMPLTRHVQDPHDIQAIATEESSSPISPPIPFTSECSHSPVHTSPPFIR